MARNPLAAAPEDRDRTQTWTLCPRSICDKGLVFDTIDGIRKPPGYTCSVCNGVGFVLSQTTGSKDLIGAVYDALEAFAIDKWGVTNPVLVADDDRALRDAYMKACPFAPSVMKKDAGL